MKISLLRFLVCVLLSTFPLTSLASETVTQLLWVKASTGPTSVAQMWSFESGKWTKHGTEFPVVVGRNGTTVDKYEGDGKTPEGVFPLTQAFGVAARTDLRLDYTKIETNDKWIDDSNHPDYNKWIRGETTASSYENLLRTDGQYDLLAVVGYNMFPSVPGRGSAIFVHIWLEPTRGTAGCVAMAPAQMETVLKWLDSAKNPHIQIGGQL